MSIIKQIGKLTAEIDRDTTGKLTITLTVPGMLEIDQPRFEELLRELVGAAHDVLVIWSVL